MSSVSDWISKNPVLFSLIIWPLLTGIITWLFKPRTAEQYAAMNPKIAAVLKFLGSTGWDVPHMLDAIYELLNKGVARPVKLPVIASKAVRNADSMPPPALPPSQPAA
jgi:hypothetical protein